METKTTQECLVILEEIININKVSIIRCNQNICHIDLVTQTTMRFEQSHIQHSKLVIPTLKL